MEKEVQIKGRVFVGVMRGWGMISHFFDRLKGILGFVPFKGTLNIKLEREIDIHQYATKSIDHILIDGTRHLDALIAPVILTVGSEEYVCWAMRDMSERMSGIYTKDIVEIVAKENLSEKFGLKNDDEVIVTFFDTGRRKKELPFMGPMRKLYGVEPRQD